MAIASTPAAMRRADRRLGLVFVQGHHHLAEAIDPLRHAGDEALGHDRLGFLAFREMHDEAYVAALHAARAAHDVDHVVVALGGDEPDPGAAFLHDRVGADRRAVRQERYIGIERVRHDADPLGRRLDRVDHAAREIVGRRGRPSPW